MCLSMCMSAWLPSWVPICLTLWLRGRICTCLSSLPKLSVSQLSFSLHWSWWFLIVPYLFAIFSYLEIILPFHQLWAIPHLLSYNRQAMHTSYLCKHESNTFVHYTITDHTRLCQRAHDIINEALSCAFQMANCSPPTGGYTHSGTATIRTKASIWKASSKPQYASCKCCYACLSKCDAHFASSAKSFRMKRLTCSHTHFLSLPFKTGFEDYDFVCFTHTKIPLCSITMLAVFLDMALLKLLYNSWKQQ